MSGQNLNKNQNSLIEARNISVKFGQRAGLKNVSVTVQPGKVLTLIGPNGAGKTTLVRVLLGLLKPDAGIIQRQRNLIIGYVPQKLAFSPTMPMTVNRFLKIASPVKNEQIATILIEVGVPSIGNELIQNLSGGELQRIHIARALLREPNLLVLDEPTQNVDYSGQIALYELITTIRHRRNCSVLVISHDLHLVMSKTDHVICLNQHICCEGQPEKVSQHPEYLELFGPSVSKHLAVYRHNHQYGLTK